MIFHLLANAFVEADSIEEALGKIGEHFSVAASGQESEEEAAKDFIHIEGSSTFLVLHHVEDCVSVHEEIMGLAGGGVANGRILN